MAKKNEPKVNLVEVLKEVMDAKNMDDAVIEGALKQALISAARKYLHIDKKIEVDIDKETNEIHVFLRVEVVDDYPDYDPSMTAEQVEEMDEGYMLVPEAQEYNEDAQPGDFLEMEVPTTSFGRQAIQTAKQLLTQQIRDAERQKITDTYRGRIGTMISGEVLRLEGRNVIVSLGKQTEAMIPPREQIGHERLVQGQSVKAVIARVEDSAKNGAQVVLSRASGDFLKELFRQEVPEIYDGSVEIKGVAREPGYRAKIAVYSRDEKIDPVGACDCPRTWQRAHRHRALESEHGRVHYARPGSCQRGQALRSSGYAPCGGGHQRRQPRSGHRQERPEREARFPARGTRPRRVRREGMVREGRRGEGPGARPAPAGTAPCRDPQG